MHAKFLRWVWHFVEQGVNMRLKKLGDVIFQNVRPSRAYISLTWDIFRPILAFVMYFAPFYKGEFYTSTFDVFLGSGPKFLEDENVANLFVSMG